MRVKGEVSYFAMIGSVQLFLLQAFLMDCLIDACVRLKKSAPIGGNS